MKYGFVVLVSLVMLFLAGCSTGGPSNAEAHEVIYGVYFKEADILAKRQCELTPYMQETGETNVWLVQYRFKERNTETDKYIILSEKDSEEHPWGYYFNIVGPTDQELQEICP